ncbi:SusD/RagB family nutrient-binding outer membrane lipoprotein [Aquimarina agarivorans]|uniref:SusD/RagB family nutrient-binding outer membrane lipoprotein n=1 Tax=Aquimarina agarivorans TaxID=980584 RepID=UPI000248FAB5|nr:SusD/RagB family nutrient-binding outer membrane lipoprotein [Aquimarina agarivorans]
MKHIIKIVAISFLMLNCDNDFEEINTNPNEPAVVLANAIFNSATKELTDRSRDVGASGRVTLPWMQYWGQTSYADEDRYDYRESSGQNYYEFLNKIGNDFKNIIDLNEDAATKDLMSTVGNNQNQIAVSRIMLSYIFHQLVDTFGDVPYYSFGSDNPSFQAFALNENILLPEFANQEIIYNDLLSELRAASDQLVLGEPVFISGDNIFNGDASKWKKFANSLILRVANRLRNVNPDTATAAIDEAIDEGVFTSNADNAVQPYQDADNTASPLYIAFFVNNRTDFAVAAPFINLLKGGVGFGLDPRLYEFASPVQATIASIGAQSLADAEGNSVTEGNPDDYIGIPYAYETVQKLPFSSYSFPNFNVLRRDFGETLMEYAEVAFIISEHMGFDQTQYENGIKASMERWGVSEVDITNYLETLPAASEETVMTQKYIALYMQPYEAWAEYRRTGFPKTLLLPNEQGMLSPSQVASSTDITSATYTFEPRIAINDLPTRLRYPQVLQTLNGENRASAVQNLDEGDTVQSKLFWDVN